MSAAWRTGRHIGETLYLTATAGGEAEGTFAGSCIDPDTADMLVTDAVAGFICRERRTDDLNELVGATGLDRDVVRRVLCAVEYVGDVHRAVDR